MNNNLSNKQKQFVKMMLRDPEKEKWGFELLSKRDDLHIFFYELKEKGLFFPG